MGTMARHRCTICRNPIRNVAVARPAAAEDAWYHQDCWAELCSSEQQRYETEVRDSGLAALLAPYLVTRQPAAGVATPDLEQTQT